MQRSRKRESGSGNQESVAHPPSQAGTVPFRRDGERFSVCLITAASSQNWGIPKGTIEPGDSPETTALLETWEEAGLRGRLVGNPIGTYQYRKYGALLTVAVYLMEVELELDDWDEREIRKRRWVEPDLALQLLDTHPARSIVELAFRTLRM